jgi:hypothetical protein
MTRGLVSAVALGAAVPGCGMPQKYYPPDLPATQLTQVTVEARAEVKSVDGKLPLNYAGAPAKEFWVAHGCHVLDVRYEETYVQSQGVAFIMLWNPLVATATVAASAAATAANTRVTSYETDTPIRFNVPAKPGMKYWVTSTFTGDVFMPRIAVLNAANERVGVILPNQPCG